MRKSMIGVVSAFALAVVAGCGSSGGPGSGGSGSGQLGETVSVGPLQVGADSAAALQTTMLTSPGTSRIAFAALHGSRIVRLAEMGYGRIAFQTSRDGNREIYVMNADGSGLTNLTQNASVDVYPAWSPDGEQIAFHSDRDGNLEIYSMNADGTDQTRLTNYEGEDCAPAWSPDGRKIAFYSQLVPFAGEAEIYVINADGSGRTRLTNNSVGDYRPAWSPDGRKIAFISARDGNAEVYAMNADGSAPTRLTNDAANDQGPAWSPDGRQIAFYSNRSGNDEIYVMNADGSDQTNLTNNAAADTFPTWSPDGRSIAFASDRDGNRDIYIMNADGSEQTNVTNHKATDWVPAWCPAPSVVRSLIGASGSDGGSDPPFGHARPLAVVGLNSDGMVSATTIDLAKINWPSVDLAPLQGIGTDLAGAKIIGSSLRNVTEDMGRGLPARNWAVSGSPATGAVLVFWSGETGKVSAVLATSDTALSDAPAALSGGRVIVHGTFVAVYSASDPGRNLVGASSATEVVLNSRTGEVVATRTSD